MIILKCLLWVVISLLAIILLVSILKITIFIKYFDEKPKIIIKVLCFRIDILEKINKAKLKKDAKKAEQDISKDIKKDVEKEDKGESKEKIKLKTIDDYLKVLELSIEILSELAFSFTFNDIFLDLKFGFTQADKTGKYIGYSWSIYGNFIAFLRSNFKVKRIDSNISPMWNVLEDKVLINTEIVINTRILRIIRHTKFKNIMEIRKRVL